MAFKRCTKEITTNDHTRTVLMNEHRPYEDELLKKLEQVPLPDEDAAWADMRRRLDKDDDEGIITVPPLLRGCFAYALLFSLLFFGWLIFIWPNRDLGDQSINAAPVKPATIERSATPREQQPNTNNQARTALDSST